MVMIFDDSNINPDYYTFLIRVYDSDLTDSTFSFEFNNDNLLYETRNVNYFRFVFHTTNNFSFNLTVNENLLNQDYDIDDNWYHCTNIQLVNEWKLSGIDFGPAYSLFDTITRPGYSDTNKFYFENLSHIGNSYSLLSGKKLAFGSNISLYYVYLNNCRILMRPNKQIIGTEEECTAYGSTLSCNFESNEVSRERLVENDVYLPFTQE